MKQILVISALIVVGSAFEFLEVLKDSLTRSVAEPVALGHSKDDIIRGASSRNAITGKDRRWPSGVIPYTYSTKYDDSFKKFITDGMKAIQDKTCIKFVEKTNETNYISFAANPKDVECSSYVGREGKGQQVVYLSFKDLGNGRSQTCFTHATVVHELMHAIGLDHEHNRADRGNFVTIHEDRVDKDQLNNFDMSRQDEFFDYGCPYNYESVMHYDQTSFSKDKKSVTMEAKNSKFAEVIGKVKDAHATDYEKINRIYGCKKVVAGHTCSAKPPVPCFDDPKQKQACEQILKNGQCDTQPLAKKVCKKSCNGCID